MSQGFVFRTALRSLKPERVNESNIQEEVRDTAKKNLPLDAASSADNWGSSGRHYLRPILPEGNLVVTRRYNKLFIYYQTNTHTVCMYTRKKNHRLAGIKIVMHT